MAEILVATRRLTKKIWCQLPYLSLTGWLLFVGPLTLALAFILSVGPELQKSIFSVLGSNAPDIYSAVYQDAISRFPTIMVWLSAAFHWLYLLLAGSIIALSLRAASFKAFILSIGVWSAILLTLVDFTAAALYDTFEVSRQIANVTANIIGGAAVATLIAGGLVLFRRTMLALHVRMQFACLAGALVLSAFGAAISAAVFLGLHVFFQPLSAKLDLVLTPPVNGFYWSDGKDEPAPVGKANSARNFNFLPAGKGHGGASIQNSDGSLTALWRRTVGTRRYDLEIRLFGDCIGTNINDLQPSLPLLTMQDVKTVSVALDNGVNYLHLVPGPDRVFEAKVEGPNLYWLTRDEKDNSIKVTHFSSGENDRLQVSSSDQMVFKIGAAMLVNERGYFTNGSRTITIDVDGRLWRGMFNRSGPVNDNQGVHCHPIITSTTPSAHNVGETEFQVSSNDMHIAALVTITPTSLRPHIYTEPETMLTVHSVMGWTSVTNLPQKALRNASGGELSGIATQGVSDLEIDWAKIQTRPHEHLLIIGELRGEYVGDGQVAVRGNARALWKNSTRLNSTRWEKLPTEWQIAAFSAFLGIFLAAAKWIWPKIRALKSEDVKAWTA